MVYSLSQDGSLKIVRGSYSVNSKSVGFRASRLSDFVIGHNPVSFSDVPKDAWYKDALTFVAARDIFPVTVGKEFRPYALVERGEFVAMLMNALASLEPTGNN